MDEIHGGSTSSTRKTHEWDVQGYNFTILFEIRRGRKGHESGTVDLEAGGRDFVHLLFSLVRDKIVVGARANVHARVPSVEGEASIGQVSPAKMKMYRR